ncbi:hypothetical protein KDN24_15170 [Bacillus sp. Bva_UNVM-123]|uniref:hypothetical protein n=1 Tax=Bacillus sp. Bva_UNVM-123 TaxID=2829798 RepID=UPI00391FA9AB
MGNHDTFLNKVKQLQLEFLKHSKVKKIVFISLLSSFSAIFQSAGGFFPGIGYLINPLATAPIILSAAFSQTLGFFAYLLTILLLLIVQPSELIVFPFTTGLLGIAIGVSIYYLKKGVSIVLYGAIALTAGICLLLYGLNFPVLGPVVSHSFSILVVGMIFVFSFFYSWLWMVISKILIKKFTFLKSP